MLSTHWFRPSYLQRSRQSMRVRAATAGASILAIALIGTGLSRAQSDSDAAGGSAESEADAVGTIVPVHREPHHRQVFQYGPVRILDLQLPPDDRSWFHSHEWPVLYMTLGTSAVRMQNLGDPPPGSGRGGAVGGRRGGGAAGAGAAGGGAAGPGAAGRGGTGPAVDGTANGATAGGQRGGGAPPAAPARPAPRATSTTSYVETPVTHRIENVGDGLFRAMAVINETAGDDSRSVDQAGFTAEPELTNAWFRAYRVALDPGQSTATHRHTTPVVIFQATDGTGDAEGPMRFEFNEPGQWAFFDSGHEHVISNRGPESMQLLEIEVRLTP